MNSWDDWIEDRLQAWRVQGLQRSLRTAHGSAPLLSVAGRLVVSFASNDYLGLSRQERVIAAAGASLQRSGAGATASRLICGTRPEHEDLERRLAGFKRTEGALVFASGYQAALAVLGALLAEGGATGSLTLIDRLAHACLIDGVRLSRAPFRTFRHNDVDDLRRLLRDRGERAGPGPGASDPAGTPSPHAARKLVVIESLYSMDGDLAPLAGIWEAVQEAGALLLVDEAHATGVLGREGRGLLADLFPGALPPQVLALGTLSKALGSQGGFLCAARRVLDLVLHAGRPLLFSTGLAPALAAAAGEALRLVEEEPGRRLRLLELSAGLRLRLGDRGFRILGGPGPILPVWVGDETQALEAGEALLAEGYWVPAIRFPTVRRGQARLRLSVTADHTAEQIEGLLAALERVAPATGWWRLG